MGTITEVSIPIGTWPSGFLPAQITGWNIGRRTPPLGSVAFRMTFDHLNLTGGVPPTPPTITVEPLDRAIGVGTGTTMIATANANNSGALRYQWKKGGIDLAGATQATLSFSDTPLTASSHYQVIVSNDAGPTPSREARLTVLDARPTNILGAGFTGCIAGETIMISNTIVHCGASQLRWSVTLPDAAGWTFVSDNATTASTRPSAGTPSLIEWIWTTVPASLSPLSTRCRSRSGPTVTDSSPGSSSSRKRRLRPHPRETRSAVAMPVSPTAEGHYGFLRLRENDPFTEAQRDLAFYALRGLTWFHHPVLLAHGVGAARARLSPMDRRVLASAHGSVGKAHRGEPEGHTVDGPHLCSRCPPENRGERTQRTDRPLAGKAGVIERSEFSSPRVPERRIRTNRERPVWHRFNGRSKGAALSNKAATLPQAHEGRCS